MARIYDLPTETLLDIFDYLALSTFRYEYIAALLVCRQWYHAGLPNLYQHIALVSRLGDTSQLPTFYKKNNDLDLVKSMTYHVTQSHLMGFAIKLPKASHRLTQMISLPLRMPNLTSLSIIHVVHAGSKTYAFPGAELFGVLKLLPLSVTSLEIDILDRYMDPHMDNGPSEEHICTAVSPLLLRLRHLRLRPARCCPGLFAAFDGCSTRPISPLQTLTLRTDSRLTGHRRPYYPRVCARNTTYSQTDGQVNTPGAELPIPQNLAREAHHLWQDGAFPHLRAGYVIGHQPTNNDANSLPPATPLLFTAGTTYDAYKIWDFVSNRTQTLPNRARGGSSELVMIRALNNVDYFGSEESIDKAIEPCPWKQNTLGCRQLSEPLLALDSGFESLGMDTSGLMNRDTAVARHDVKCALWNRERQVGAFMMQARRVEGLNDDFSVSEVLPRGWAEYQDRDDSKWRIHYVGTGD
ncbi:hypothetical protein EJ05DRAFT_91203 [Pseudovirgaria hyperparasitica]|uniref:F-box domain-containing protein n=1 Tax=Pseudovirgaria hyperparasitica TaxID=470096 RepID=A0A6A6W509_9PEZI|nr:uncharacterized protein EJ05DRAFT_91203 [Pseudovirgaria hyperparasitica]KAF2756141.1 hypothetical protein EJ05DRAFT_91203 [Pseudovirgaria hyperparasitica]